MIDLKDTLEILYELNELRSQSKELREASRLALTDIKNTSTESEPVQMKTEGVMPVEGWISSGTGVEVALLVKVQNHHDLSETDEENDSAEASQELKATLASLNLKQLFPNTTGLGVESDNAVPVLVAARSMQALVMRSNSVFSTATMLCYYRIVRELYTAAGPDWTVGAARAGTGGRTSAFITGECVRAIFAFEDAMKRTADFFKQTDRLVGRYELLSGMMSVFVDTPSDLPNTFIKQTVNDGDSSLQKWIQATLERMWFDWYVSTNPRHGNIALHCGADENELLHPPNKHVDMVSLGKYLDSLKTKLASAVNHARKEIEAAESLIVAYRRKTEGKAFTHVLDEDGTRRVPIDELPDDEARRTYHRDLRKYDRAESAHLFAIGLVAKAKAEAAEAADLIQKTGSDINSLKDTLNSLRIQFQHNASSIHKALEPAKKYIRYVLYRELAAKTFGKFDAGELVFAAGSYGAITGWQKSELLTKACDTLVEALPETGRFETSRPFQSTLRGHRMIPIGCEMTRCLAQLLQQTEYKLEPKTVRSMLNIFRERPIKLDVKDKDDEKYRVGWNFDGSPNPDRACIWVTAVSVLALDRVVRMLNERINSIIFSYFQVIKPRGIKGRLTLNDLVYSDIGLSTYSTIKQPSMGLRLEQMRAHLMRAALPDIYKDKNQKERFFSAIFYGPSGTGKTTLAEALALSAEVPLIRLSPSDLILQGHSEIEGRARIVFEALSMLSQTVVILDEFEGVVGVGTGGNELDAFELLRRGMLPKLTRLYEAAKAQSYVYCLATNFLAKIDPAAKRLRRFDLHLPVYAPDPLSRAGMLLYRFYRIDRKLQPWQQVNLKNKDGLVRRLLEIVSKTKNMRANSLAEDYFRLPDWEDQPGAPPPDFIKDIPLFWYVATGDERGEFVTKLDKLKEERKRTEDQVDLPDPCTLSEQEEYAWLCGSEMAIDKLLQKTTNITLADFDRVLKTPSDEIIEAARVSINEKIEKRKVSAQKP